MVLVLAMTAVGIDNLAVVSALLFVGYGFLGIIIPVSSVLALEPLGAIAGTAASLMSAIQLATGSLCVWIAGTFADGSVQPMLGAIAGVAVISVVATLSLMPRR
jgi:DHA1 family bicyclomycin/chloramphenicol resistance-like MFS transporter